MGVSESDFAYPLVFQTFPQLYNFFSLEERVLNPDGAVWVAFLCPRR